MTTPLTGPLSLSTTNSFIAASVLVGLIFEAAAPCASLAVCVSWSLNSPFSSAARGGGGAAWATVVAARTIAATIVFER
jgi:hypothetical protein